MTGVAAKDHNTEEQLSVGTVRVFDFAQQQMYSSFVLS